MKIKISENLFNFAKLLSKKAELYLVGGYVRNYFLGVLNSDIDLTSKLTVEALEKLTQGTQYKVQFKNKELGTALILTENEVWEYSTFRKEVYPPNGSHTPVKVTFISDLLQDAKRRDFTANAIYYNILKDEIVDVYSGTLDIKKKKLKAVETPDYVFENDGLRILRMVRLSCELNFKLERETYLKAKQMVYRLKDISGTRKYEELVKILNSGTRYSISNKNAFKKGLKMFNAMGIWSTYFPSVAKINYKTVLKAQPDKRFIALLIDLINTVNPDCIAYYLEFALGKDGLNFSKADQKETIQSINAYFDALNGISNKKYFFNYYNQFEIISDLLAKTSKNKFKKYNFYFKYINKFKIPIQIKDIKVSAQDIKEAYPQIPAKKYKQILEELFNRVFDAKVKNEKEELLKEVKNLIDFWNSDDYN